MLLVYQSRIFMIKSSFLFLFLFISLNLFSQSPFEIEVSKTIGLIEKNLTLSNENTFDLKNSFFLYCLELGSSGKIENIRALKEDKNPDNNKIKELSFKIKENCEFKSSNKNLKIIIVPVLLIYSGLESEDSFLNEITCFLETIKKNSDCENVLVTKSAIVNYYRSKN